MLFNNQIVFKETSYDSDRITLANITEPASSVIAYLLISHISSVIQIIMTYDISAQTLK